MFLEEKREAIVKHQPFQKKFHKKNEEYKAVMDE